MSQKKTNMWKNAGCLVPVQNNASKKKTREISRPKKTLSALHERHATHCTDRTRISRTVSGRLYSVLLSYIFIFMTFTFQLLDKLWSQVSSLPPLGACLQFLSSIGFSIPTARRFSSNYEAFVRTVRVVRRNAMSEKVAKNHKYMYQSTWYIPVSYTHLTLPTIYSV